MSSTAVLSTKPSLSANDAAVLQALFDAESAPSAGVIIDRSRPAYPPAVQLSESEIHLAQSREVDIIRKLQEQPQQNAISAAPAAVPSSSSSSAAAAAAAASSIRNAISDLDALIDEHPTYPSAYVNRAQALRILAEQHQQNTAHSQVREYSVEPQISAEQGGDRDGAAAVAAAARENELASNGSDALFAPANVETASRLFADLSRAIALATPASPADPVSAVQARVLADAHTHRGYVLLKAARLQRKTGDAPEVVGGPLRLRGLGAEQLEEMASRDFFFGGRFGNKVAQQLAVQTNPYAKMCGAIVKEALRKEVEGTTYTAACMDDSDT